MTSQTSTVTKTVVTRSPADIDPKVAAVWAVAAATIAIVAALVAGTLLLGGRIDLITVLGPVLPVVLAGVAGYARRSTHSDLITADVETAAALTEAAAPVIEDLAPEIAPAVAQVEDGVETIRAALTAPIDPTTSPAV